MSDLIERQAAIDTIEERLQTNGYSNVGLVSELNRIIGYLKRLPSAQPTKTNTLETLDCVGRLAERKKGHWAKISPANIYECSKCGKNVMTNDISEYNFCHGCGADMRGEKEQRI